MNNQEFSRCSIDSLGSHRTSNEDSDEDLEGEEGSQNKYQSKKNKLVINFRGTGQNGQVLKEDMKNWSRKLHKQLPQDLYQRVKTPRKSILMVSA